MAAFTNTEISKAIINSYHQKLLDQIEGDVLIVGAGPAGMVAGHDLAKKGVRVTILEKRLSVGGGVWGGGMAMNEAVVQDEALPILDEMGVRYREAGDGIYTVDSVELASGLCFRAIQAGAVILNLTIVEDVCLSEGRVTGLVLNRTGVYETVPVDPIMFSAKAVIDGTGHEAGVVEMLRRRGLLKDQPVIENGCEGPMDAAAGERFVEDNVSEVYPGLWVSGMSVCATFSGPRMGPIFGGMLLSGRRVAEKLLPIVSGACCAKG